MSLSNTTQKVTSRLGFLTQMQRYPANGWLAGVCAGIADYFGWRVKLVRLVTALLFLFTAGTVVVVAYIALWFLMDEGDIGNPNRPTYEQGLAASVAAAGSSEAGTGTTASGSQIRERFSVLDARLRRMEEAALSKDAALFRELEKLEREGKGQPQ